MLATLALHSSTTLAPTKLLPLLSLLPRQGLNASVFQSNWAEKGLPVPSSSTPLDQSCRWEVQKVELKNGEKGVDGDVWGVKYWKGKRVTPEGRLDKIRGARKYLWATQVMPPKPLQRTLKKVGPAEEAEEAVKPEA
ncbi:hypothetical protein MNV49_002129 [Pseudohyphozyma bogoriensis]|nr:hypothetical protein MNV49_002129 [Pseudohyphozyma bogoriensis]